MKTFNLVELSYNNTLQVRYKINEEGVETNHRGIVDSTQDLSEAPELVKALAAEFPWTEHTNPDGACCWADFIRVVDAERYHLAYQLSDYIYKDEKVSKQAKRPVIEVDCLEDITAHPEKVQRFAALIFTPEVKAAYIASLPTVDEPVMSKRQVTVDLPVVEDYNEIIPAVTREIAAVLGAVYDSTSEVIEGAFEIEQEAYIEIVEPERIEVRQRQVMETVLVDVEETTVLEGAVQKVVKAHQAEQEQGVVETIGVTDESGAKVMEEYDTGEVVTKIQYKGELYASDWDGTL